MKNSIYNSKMISAGIDLGIRVPEFKREFHLGSEIKSAVLNISSLGVYEAHINGARVGDYLMTPGWTEYEKRLFFDSYDVTEMLKINNEIRVTVGHGWWASRMPFSSAQAGQYKDHPSLILSLDVLYCDGKMQTIYTNNDWECRESGFMYSQIYDGEYFDETQNREFNIPVICEKFDTSLLLPHKGPYVKEIERIGAKRIFKTPNGDCVVDFGQEITGTVEFTAYFDGGETVTVEHAEVLDADGNFYNENYRTAKALLRYTAKAGLRTYRAHHTFFGFRYIRISGFKKDIKESSFNAIVMHSQMKKTADFECKNEKLNRLFSNILWSQRGNFLEIPTDCPQRDERMGWLGDAEVFARTALINFDCKEFLEKWLDDMILAQNPDGSIPNVVPTPPRMHGVGSSAWMDGCTIIPWEIYLATGDKSVLKRCLTMMKKYISFLVKAGDKRYLWQGGNHFGDWLALDAPPGSRVGETDIALISTAYYYRSAKITAMSAKELGQKYERYEALANRVRSAFLKEFVKGKRLKSDTQTAYALAIAFGLTDNTPALKKAFGERLTELVENAQDSLTTGFVGTPVLLPALSEIGRADKAYTLLLREKFPSWLYSVNIGATTIWEHWDGMREDGSMWSESMNSFNHYAYGAVAEWIYSYAMGVSPLKPGYREFKLAPIPDARLGYAKATIQTPYGEILSEWEIGNEETVYRFTVPMGTVAHLSINGQTKLLTQGSYTLKEKQS